MRGFFIRHGQNASAPPAGADNAKKAIFPADRLDFFKSGGILYEVIAPA